MAKFSEIEPKLVMYDIKTVLTVFKSFGVKAYLSYGVVLGAVRDKKLIPYDDDVDFDVIDEISYEKRMQIGFALTDLGFKVQKISMLVYDHYLPLEEGYNGDEHSGIIAVERNCKFSIFFYRLEDCPKHGPEYVCYGKRGAPPLITTYPKFFEKPDTIKLYGEKIETPGPVKEYLSAIYGEWKKPQPGYHAPQHKALHA